MKAVISTTYSDTYLFFLPIVTFLWNKLGVDVICFMPDGKEMIKNGSNILQGVYFDGNQRIHLITKTIKANSGKCDIHIFRARQDKEATYAQCSRLYAACLDLPESEYLVTSDIDMAVFSRRELNAGFTIFGNDLVPPKQYPMCYISASVGEWRKAFNLKGIHYQDALDKLLGEIDCENMRGNYWGKDQETSFDIISPTKPVLINRAREGTQFATHRVDRDDSFWRERITPDLVDAHLWRPGYTDENFANILELIQTMYPNENLSWMRDYQQQYKSLL